MNTIDLSENILKEWKFKHTFFYNEILNEKQI